jgi:hypothetical protein
MKISSAGLELLYMNRQMDRDGKANRWDFAIIFNMPKMKSRKLA